MQNSPWPSIDTGKLRHKGTIQQSNLSTPDALGQPDTSWTVVRNCWASIDVISANETGLPDLIVSRVTHVIVIRWTPVSIDASMRAVFGNRIYQISAVENVGQRNVKLKLLVFEIDPTS